MVDSRIDLQKYHGSKYLICCTQDQILVVNIPYVQPVQFEEIEVGVIKVSDSKCAPLSLYMEVILDGFVV